MSKKLDVLAEAVLQLLPQGSRDDFAKRLTGAEQSPELDEVREATGLMMLELGIDPGLDGFQALVEGVTLVAKEQEYADQITGMLYPAIGEAVGHTGSQVERSIRHAIEKWVDDAPTEDMYILFPAVSRQKGKIANKQFIVRCAMEVRRRIWGYLC